MKQKTKARLFPFSVRPIPVGEMLKIIGPRRRAAFDMLHDLRAAHTKIVTVKRIDLCGLGSSLSQLRRDAGITQHEMARCLHVSQGYLAMVESGQRRLHIVKALLFVHYCTSKK